MKNYTKKSLKASNGITLIALVITIIVLIILASISISTLLGDNGIITKSREAKESQRGAEVQDEVELAVAENDYYDGIDDTTTTRNSKESVVDKLVKDKKLNSNEKKILIDDDENEIKIGIVTIDFSRLNDRETINTITETANGIEISLSIAGRTVNGTEPPNPDESIFEHTEGTIDTGYVIKDKNNGNEFVWVPVKADQKIKLKVTSEEEITKIEFTDSLNTTTELEVPEEMKTNYKNNNIEPNRNGGYKVKVTAGGKTATATLVVRNLYAQDTFKDDPYNIYAGYADSEENYKNSVNTNGGFYIGRYEAGTNPEKTNRTRGNKDHTVDEIITANGVPVCKQDQTPYNCITQSQAKGLVEKMYEGKSFTCTLPTGAAWDRTLGWLVNTEDKTLSEISSNSSNWGNYSTVSFSVISTAKGTTSGSTYSAVSDSTKPASRMLLTTGAATDRNVSNNIYDLAGNVEEWTTEVIGSNPNPASRGGYYYFGGDETASIRHNSSDNLCNIFVGFRPALYL